ncbi:MAG: VOC family protein [Planctomycetes bacterium]|nr:VOC family protein [Planctomycetota bacterium]
MAKKSAAATAVLNAPAKKMLANVLPAPVKAVAAKPLIAKNAIKSAAMEMVKPIAKAALKNQPLKAAIKNLPLKADTAALPREIGHVMIYVKNWDASLNWYKNVLGLPVKFESEGWAEFATEGTTLALHGLDACCAEGHQARETGICFNVKNVQQTLSVLRERAIKIVTEPHQVCENTFCAEIADLEGNTLSIVGK